MSADNFLGIYVVNKRKYIARSCWSECERDCANCEQRIIFMAKSLREAIKLAQKELQNPNEVFEYGIHFLNVV